MKDADSANYVPVGLGLLGFAPFVAVALVACKYSVLGFLYAALFFAAPACLGFLGMAAFICVTAHRCGPPCVRFLPLAGLYGVLVLVVGVVSGEGLFSLLLAVVAPADTFNRSTVGDLAGYVRLCLAEGAIPAFTLGSVGGLICRFFPAGPTPAA